MNRGLAKRPVFLGLSEIRYFLSRLAREVRSGEVEVHAYCFLTTHFHLLLLSRRGHLSDALRRIENSFVRWFNRRHGRDGSLFRGRFTSRNVDTDRYHDTVVRYIDLNPVDAGLVDSAEDYPHGSARFRDAARAPRWFTATLERPPARPFSRHAAWVVERRLEKPTTADPLDDLVGAAPERVRRWMESRARLADGSRPGTCLLSPEALDLAIAHVREGSEPMHVMPRARRKDGWSVLRLGLSRDVVGLSTAEAALGLRIPRSSAGHMLLEHRRLLLADSTYSDLAARVVQSGLEITFGTRAEKRDELAGLERL